MKLELPGDTKRCSGCEEIKLRNQFYWNGASRAAKCIQCTAKYTEKYRAAHREQLREKNRIKSAELSAARAEARRQGKEHPYKMLRKERLRLWWEGWTMEKLATHYSVKEASIYRYIQKWAK